MATANWNVLGHQAQPGVPAGPGVVEGNEIPYQPWALARQKENFARRATADPETKCYLPGVPRIMYLPLPFQIVQVPTKMVMLFEYAHAIRHIHTNGNGHPPGHIDWWLGDSRGRWRATRSWSTAWTSTTRPGSIAPATFTATNCTWSNGSPRTGPITSPTR